MEFLKVQNMSINTAAITVISDENDVIAGAKTPGARIRLADGKSMYFQGRKAETIVREIQVNFIKIGHMFINIATITVVSDGYDIVAGEKMDGLKISFTDGKTVFFEGMKAETILSAIMEKFD